MWTRLRGARAARRKPRAQCKKAAKECSSGEGMLLTELFSALGQPALCDCFSVFVSIRYSRLLVPVSVVRRCPEQVQSGMYSVAVNGEKHRGQKLRGRPF